MIHSAVGIAYSLASRIALGEVELSNEQWEKLRRTQKKMDDVSEVLEDFDTTNPVSWARTAIKATGFLIKQHGRYESKWAFFEDHACEQMECGLDFLFEELISSEWTHVVFKSDWCVLYRIPITEEVTVVVGDYSSDWQERELWVPESLNEDTVREAISNLFWADRNAVLVDERREEFVARELDLSNREYWGPLRKLIDEWREFRRLGIPRNVLLHGKPGVGKTEFSYYAARELSDRTVVLSGNFVEQSSTTDWYSLVDLLDPEMVIVEDIDRLGKKTLSRRLRMFEEGHCDVPFVLLNSNDLDKFPQAFLRPGRVSRTQIVEDPDEETCWEIIKNVGRKIVSEMPADVLKVEPGWTPPESRREELIELMSRLSIDHVRERIKRALVHGWETDQMAGDVTFNPPEPSEVENGKSGNGSSDAE